jgi:cell fate regulator YaaT (PSP1 superfamily)
MDLAGIRFRGLCKMNHYDCTGTSLGKGDYAVVMTDRGPALGEIIQRIDNVTSASEKTPFPKVVRGASADDLHAHQ